MTAPEDLRGAAIKRLGARREFRLHLTVYVLVNTLLIVIWAATGAGYFWPIWPIAGWGIGLASHGLTLRLQRPFSEDDIEAELRRDRTRGAP